MKKKIQFAAYMTVRQVMDKIGARSASTVTRLIYDEDKPRPEGKRLAATRFAEGRGQAWMVNRKSVAKFLAEERARSSKVGFPRGESRAG